MKSILFTISFLFLILSGFSQSGTLKVIIPDIKSNKGNIKVALYNKAGEKGFLKNLESSFRKKEVQIKNNSAIAVFKNIPYGTYAVSLFQDENNNGILDRAPVGFPTEPYGISGNKKTIGPPKFEDGKFLFNSKNKTVIIELKSYLK